MTKVLPIWSQSWSDYSSHFFLHHFVLFSIETLVKVLEGERSVLFERRVEERRRGTGDLTFVRWDCLRTALKKPLAFLQFAPDVNNNMREDIELGAIPVTFQTDLLSTSLVLFRETFYSSEFYISHLMYSWHAESS